ncbi:helix-turn-helix domain-containing protein [Streptomyces sp. SP18CS02]|uniref:helix-turn-helix domain-containing protein n=1 Tax=Streptomyces sp. SP18CS02 TaxID=3002531 RepID=UPI002E76D700|nr:helix-turn-helix transcriptional regulator [Streptomyces sp. SP18CS02]
MAANNNPTVRGRRLGAQLRRLRLARGMTGVQVAAHLLISQAKVSHMETGRRAASPRDVRELCKLYGVTDQHVIDSLMELARESNRQGWWCAYGDIPHSVYVGMETDATSIHAYEPLMVPDLLQTPAYAAAVIEETIPLVTVEQAAARLKVRLRRQHRIYAPARPLRLWFILDESVLRRVVGSREIMREQVEHLCALSTEPHITVQVIPHTAGAHPGLAGQFSLLQLPDSRQPVVYLERFTSDLYLEKPSDVRHYSAMYARLQTQALSPAHTRHFITTALKLYTSSAPGDQPHCGRGPVEEEAGTGVAGPGDRQQAAGDVAGDDGRSGGIPMTTHQVPGAVSGCFEAALKRT